MSDNNKKNSRITDSISTISKKNRTVANYDSDDNENVKKQFVKRAKQQLCS